MKKLLIIPMLWLSTLVVTFAQRPSEKIESARIAFLTERLSLTPETAQQFWPIYNQLSDQRHELRKEEFRMRRSQKTDSLTDASAQQHIDEYFSLKEQQLALDRKMTKELAGVLSPVQIVQLIQAEGDFQRMILRKLGERRHGDRQRERPEMRR
ncbi:MAG: Spy/CpxP family protein refolding chaperone [Cyclobacteriaceae bacterium]